MAGCLRMPGCGQDMAKAQLPSPSSAKPTPHLAAVCREYRAVYVGGVPPELLEGAAALDAVHPHGAVERGRQDLWVCVCLGVFAGFGGLKRWVWVAGVVWGLGGGVDPLNPLKPPKPL